ncbi:unnamed protein product, partial [marine sediment metagenome]
CLLPEFNQTSYKLVFEVSDGVLSVDEIDYKVIKRVKINKAPVLIQNISNLNIIKNKNITVDLSEYFYDEDNDVLSYSYYGVDNISVVIEDNIATIIPDKGFTGKKYMFFKANDSEFVGFSDVFSVNIVEELVREETLQKERVVINRPVKWVKKVKLDSVKKNVAINITPLLKIFL